CLNPCTSARLGSAEHQCSFRITLTIDFAGNKQSDSAEEKKCPQFHKWSFVTSDNYLLPRVLPLLPPDDDGVLEREPLLLFPKEDDEELRELYELFELFELLPHELLELLFEYELERVVVLDPEEYPVFAGDVYLHDLL